MMNAEWIVKQQLIAACTITAQNTARKISNATVCNSSHSRFLCSLSYYRIHNKKKETMPATINKTNILQKNMRINT
jgi:hypothetical protein